MAAPDKVPGKGPGLSISDLNLELGGHRILRDINLQVAPGTIHCLIGPNGGGKTSLLRCILGQMPHSGKIELQPFSDGEANVPPTIGYVPQLLDFDKSLPVTVTDFMAIVANGWRPAFSGIRPTAQAAAAAALARVGFQGRMDTRLGSLSGGERQRVLVAQALMPMPELLILDEPFNNIDRKGEETLLALIKGLALDGITVLWVAHDLGQVRTMADALSCIAGSVVYTGVPAEFLDSLQADELFHLAAGQASSEKEVVTP